MDKRRENGRECGYTYLCNEGGENKQCIKICRKGDTIRKVLERFHYLGCVWYGSRFTENHKRFSSWNGITFETVWQGLWNRILRREYRTIKLSNIPPKYKKFLKKKRRQTVQPICPPSSPTLTNRFLPLFFSPHLFAFHQHALTLPHPSAMTVSPKLWFNTIRVHIRS